jgi:hypothetical protein
MFVAGLFGLIHMGFYHILSGLADSDIRYVITSQRKMADAMGFSVR